MDMSELISATLLPVDKPANSDFDLSTEADRPTLAFTKQ